MEFDVTPVLTPELAQALLDGIARVSQQHHILKTRDQLRARQHIDVLYRNAQAANLDVVDEDLN
jgi:hypothetical protein